MGVTVPIQVPMPGRNVMPFRAIGALLCGGLLMLTASSAFAAVNLNSSRSNIYRSNCIKAGGKIVTPPGPGAGSL